MEDDSGYFFFQSPWKNIFLWHFMEVEKEALIVTPAIDMDILRKIQSILIARSERKLELKLLVRMSEKDILTRKIDPEAIRILALLLQEPRSRIQIRFASNLSLTAMVLDDGKALMVTGDLTSGSLLDELNYGQLMTGEDLVGAFKEDLLEIWKGAEQYSAKEMIGYMEEMKSRLELRHELILEDEERGLSFRDDEFLHTGNSVEPLGMDRQEPHLDEAKKIIKELLIRARDSVEEDNAQAALFYLEEGLALDKDNSALLLEKGKVLFNLLKETEEAQNCFNRVLDQNDDEMEAWALSGMCHHERGELEDALYAYDQATDIDPQHYPVWIKKGMIMGTMKGREEDALKCLEYALSKDPYNEEAWYHKASILDQRLSRMDEAILAYRSLLRINPKHVIGSFRMGLLSYKRLDNIEKAKKYFDRVVEASPDHKQAWIFKAEIAEKVDKDPESAVEFYDRAREFHPDAADLLSREISLLMKYRKKFRKAVDLADELLDINPKDPVALYVSGLGALRMEGDPKRALDLVNGSIRGDPAFKLAILTKANILAEYLNRAQDAVNLLKAALKKNKTDPELWLELGMTYFDFLYDPKDALSCFDKVTKLEKENSEGWFNKGMVLSRGFEKHQEGLNCLDEATKIDDNNYLAWAEKGRILFKVYNMTDDAMMCYKKAISIEKDDPEVLSAMALVFRAKGDDSRSEKFYRKAIEIGGTSIEPMFGLADLLIATGDMDGAQSTLNIALQADPNNERVWMVKANAFRKEGELGKAMECYKGVLRINPDNQDALNRKTSVEAQLERMT
jgi:tetratricopeptide (TPR) repeat protein